MAIFQNITGLQIFFKPFRIPTEGPQEPEPHAASTQLNTQPHLTIGGKRNPVCIPQLQIHRDENHNLSGDQLVDMSDGELSNSDDESDDSA